MENLRRMLEASDIPTEPNLSLSRHSTFRIGGIARLACFPADRNSLITCLRLARAAAVTPVVIGNASNVVFPDEGLDVPVIFTERCRSFRLEGQTLHADAGATLASLAVAARDASLGGLEFAAGIPGSLGGAVLMNAGAYGGCMAEICVASDYYDIEQDRVGSFRGAEQAFSNRSSIYEQNPRYTVLGATLTLRRAPREEIERGMRELARRRRESQPLDLPSAGSVFKRPQGYFAGKLIEDCGLKGTRIGGAEVSVKHAGFIVNRGDATAADVRALVARIRDRVYAETGVTLECEIRFL